MEFILFGKSYIHFDKIRNKSTLQPLLHSGYKYSINIAKTEPNIQITKSNLLIQNIKTDNKMQGALCIKPTILLPLPSSLSSSTKLTFLLPHRTKASRLSSLRSNNASSPSTSDTVDYNSLLS